MRLKKMTFRTFHLLAKIFWRNTRGVAATEFAMILPFMLVLLIGTVELADVINQNRKIDRMTNAVTDLVAQAETVTTSDLNNVFEIGATIIEPYETTDVYILVASVSFNEDGDATVDWSYDSEQNAPWAAGSPPPVTLPDTVENPNTSIVLGQSSLVFVSRFGSFLAEYFSRASSTTLSDTYYLRPRLTDQVRCDDC